MSKTRYIRTVDMMNKFHIDVRAPAYYGAQSPYVLEFGASPVFKPINPHATVATTVTISELVDMYFCNIEFQFIKESDIPETYGIVDRYLDVMSKYDPDKFSAEERHFLDKTQAFFEAMEEQMRRYERRHKLDKPANGLMSMLSKAQSIFKIS